MKLGKKLGFSFLAVTLVLAAALFLPKPLEAHADEPAWAQTLTVGPGGDFTTVQAAINSVGSAPTSIELQAIQLVFASVSIASDQTIKLTSGSGGPFPIGASGTGYSVIVNSGELWLENIHVHDANTTNGGGVYNSGSLFINSGTMIHSNDAQNGGGVYNDGTLTMTGGEIASNTVTDNGGGVFNAGEFTMTGGRISGNFAYSNGGGVYNSGTFTMSSGDILGNQAVNNGGGVFNAGEFTMTGGTIGGTAAANANIATFGGGVYNYGNDVTSTTTSFTMTDGLISNNKADSGGGVFNDGSLFDAEFNLQGGTISYNTAILSGSSSGGGVYNQGGTSSDGVFTMTAGTILGNTAYLMGGGVFNSGEFNMSGGDIGVSGTDGGNSITTGSGGGVLNEGSFTLSGGAISYNVSSNGHGGGVFNNGLFTMENDAAVSYNRAQYLGGGVFNNAAGSFVLSDGTISYNRAGYDGGGVYCIDGFLMTAGLITANAAESNGGGVYVEGGFTMDGGEISGNGIWSDACVTQDGGGVYARGAVSISGGTISENAVLGDGGGIYGAGGPWFVVNGEAEISGNTADSNGGGIFATGYDSAEVKGGLISQNKANKGGGICSETGITMTGGQIFENTAFLDTGIWGLGGGVYTHHLELSDGVISDNIAVGNGGGAFIVGEDSFIMSGGTIRGNQAIDGGGVYGLWFVPMEITGGEILNNTASGDGGGIFIENLDNLTVGPGVVFSGNTASKAVKDLSNLFQPAGVTWTVPFSYGNSNYDINYDGNQAFLVFVIDSYAVPTGADAYLPSETVTIYAGDRPGFEFDGWTVTSGAAVLGSAAAASTSFTMPQGNVEVTANWKQVVELPTPFIVTVNGSYAAASGEGAYLEGETVDIAAGTREGYAFKGWTVNAGGAVLANASAASTSFEMPAGNVTVTANWEAVASSPESPESPKVGGDRLVGAYAALALALLALSGPALVVARRKL